ncbi:MBL fold metallo-hydrolase [Nevskia ramosa]|uniref:MBL fold metallo-hydrolase n=1 Tax=Nevskia ramosa TaxID=64002 RepID=UPI0003FFC6DB|nr:MBL fold metallo-hydrolase [Nevskia ramosa]
MSRQVRILLAAIVITALLPGIAAAETAKLADGVFADLGSYDAIGPANRGEIANSGLIVGKRGALAIDSGVSKVHGERLHAAWTARSDKPIEALLLTQPIQEFLFGAGAFRAHGVPVLASPDAAKLMRKRCENCLTHLRELLPGGLMKGTVLVTPDRDIDVLAPIDLGGRQAVLIDGSLATTPGTLAVFDRQSGTLFAGGLIASQRVPSLRDARVTSWIAALEALRKLPLKRIVPGFGPVGDLRQIDAMQRYLRQIDAAVRSEYQHGASLLEASARVRLPEFAGWQQYDVLHPQNVQYLYRQLEDAEFR